MTTQLEFALSTARALTRDDKAELLQYLVSEMREIDWLGTQSAAFWLPFSIEKNLREAPVIYQLDKLVADFWPSDETADEFNAFVATRRRQERERWI